ncbi:MAG: glutathione peroxidase [Fibrobacter sp.]|nr:glutathione peroxidase [Fibrobacter sp.]
MICACNKPEPEELQPQPQPQPQPPTPIEDTTVVEEPQDNIYQFSVLDGNGDSVSLAQYKGKVLLVINSATQCGYTPQYTQLQQWYETYQDRGFVILDFPCNQFNGQAPGSYDDIHNYCTNNYHITFPQFAKIDVNGANESPLYTWLKSKRPGAIQWNFTKFLINRDGEVVTRFSSNYNMTRVEESIVDQLGE